ncbi:homocysteine S-methyltransferase family protein, partial [Priestia megaterium]|uniref:homocysteine S-methyltransferase family protein n=1 Tax=Priestia megaterium TaxID=1404 RepID=UPI0039A385CB
MLPPSLPPYPPFLPNPSQYTPQYHLTQQHLIQFHRPPIKPLIQPRPDLLPSQTIPNLMQATAIP